MSFRSQHLFKVSAASGASITLTVKWRLKCGTLGYHEQEPFLSNLHPRALLHATSTYEDVRRARYINLRYHIPFESEINGPYPTPINHSCGIHEKNSNVVLKSAE
jgi:hypothetical protein